ERKCVVKRLQRLFERATLEVCKGARPPASDAQPWHTRVNSSGEEIARTEVSGHTGRSLPEAGTMSKDQLRKRALLRFAARHGRVEAPVILQHHIARFLDWFAVGFAVRCGSDSNEIWPDARILPTENGAVTTATFPQFLGVFGRFLREDLKIPKEQQVLLLLDSGGGSQVHISVESSLVAEHYGLRLFFFAANCTPAFCSLDQDCNARAEARFHEILAADREMTGSGALLAARDVWSHAYRSPLIERGYAKTGIVAGKPLQPNVLLVDRAASLLRSNVPKEDVALETQEAQQLLKGIYSMPNKTEVCPECRKATPTHMAYCGHCGAKNKGYDAAMAAACKGGRASGRSKGADPVHDVPAIINGFDEKHVQERKRFMGDLLSEMRQRKRAATSDKPEPQDVASEQAVAAVADTPGQSSSAVPAASDAQAAQESDVELDLEEPDDVETFIVSHFPPADHSKVRPVAKFYVKELRLQATKKSPLSHLVQMKLVKGNMLKSKAGRSAWFGAQSANRAARFVTVKVKDTKG
ncbi:unnamed protein product, partial [Symbiodinium microadriaticum]